MEAKGLRQLLFQLLLAAFSVFSSSDYGNAGLTSTFIRSEWPSLDIPLDHEAFAIPEGYNTPQQVSPFSIKFCSFIRNLLVLWVKIVYRLVYFIKKPVL